LCRSNGATDARLGLAVSKKHAKKAVERNRIKRVVRESFRENKSRLAGLDVVVINQSGTGQAANAGLFASLDAHWDRCCKLRNSRKSLDNG
jgi:ribonuclease P protein component